MVDVSLQTYWHNHGDSLLTLVSAIGEFCLIAFMSKQGIWRKFPVFCVFITWSCVSDLAALYLQNRMNGHQYFVFFIRQTIIDAVLQFSVLVELGWSVLRPIRASLPRKALFILAFLIILAGLAIWPLAGKTVPAGYVKLSALCFHLQQTVGALRIVCFLVMAGFSQVLSIGWRDRELQIVTGLGFFSIVSLMVTMFHAQQVTGDVDAYHWLDQLVSACYFGTLSYWVMSFATKEQERKEFSPQMQNLLLQLGGGARAGRIALTDLPSERSRNKD